MAGVPGSTPSLSPPRQLGKKDGVATAPHSSEFLKQKAVASLAMNSINSLSAPSRAGPLSGVLAPL